MFEWARPAGRMRIGRVTRIRRESRRDFTRQRIWRNFLTPLKSIQVFTIRFSRITRSFGWNAFPRTGILCSQRRCGRNSRMILARAMGMKNKCALDSTFCAKRVNWERDNYLYSEEELRPWAMRTASIAEAAKDVFVITNNHYQAKGVVNALQLISMLKESKVKVPEPLRIQYPELEKIASERPKEPRLF